MLLENTFYQNLVKRITGYLEEAEVYTPPVPIEKIARLKGAEVIPYELGDEISGILVINDQKGIIGYNPSDSKRRQRFTIAHELGHYLLHHNSKDLFLDRDFLVVKYRGKKVYSRSELRQESEANAFAASILMPKSLIIAELEKEEYSKLKENELIEELAKAFDVSVHAMTYRLSDLNI